MFDRLPIVRPSLTLAVIDFMAFAFLVAIAVMWVRIVAKVTHNRVAVLVHALFAAYLVVLVSVVLLPLHGVRAAAESFQGTDPLRRAWYWGLQVHSPIVDGHWHWQRAANLAMTIPFGFGFGLLAPRIGVRRIFVACIAWAVSLELAQLSISVMLGVVYRTFDINDIIDNALGASVGLGGFVLVALWVRATRFGHDAPTDTFRGFLADSVDTFFAGYHARRRHDGTADDASEATPQP